MLDAAFHLRSGHVMDGDRPQYIAFALVSNHQQPSALPPEAGSADGDGPRGLDIKITFR